MMLTGPPASSIVTDKAAIRRHSFPRISAMFLAGTLRAFQGPQHCNTHQGRKLLPGARKLMSRPNLLSLFDDFRRHRRDVGAVQRCGYRRESWTYAKLAKVAFRLVHDLKQSGVRTGDRVLLWGPNSAEWMAAFWGCLLRGVVVVPIDDGAPPDFAARVARETSAKLVITSVAKPRLDSAIPALNLESLADTTRPPHAAVSHHPAA